jgi:hypothetical protein
MYFHLPITALQVESGEPFGSTLRVQSIVNQDSGKQAFFVTSFNFL